MERTALPVTDSELRDGVDPAVAPARPPDVRAEIFDALLSASLDGIAVLQPVLREGEIVDFRYLIVSRRAGEILGRDAEALVGQLLDRGFSRIEARLDAYRAVMATGVPRELEVDGLVDGRRRVFRIGAMRSGDRLVATLSDVTPLHEALDRLEAQQEALRRANGALQELVASAEGARAEAQATERFVASLMEAVPIPLFHWSLEGRIVRANSTYASLYGLTPETIVGKQPEDLLPSQQAAAIRERNAELLAGGTERQVYSGELRSATGPRHYTVHRALLRDADGRPGGITGAMFDVTEEVELRQRLELLAATDPLTGLYNRRVFMERLDAELARFRRYGRPAAVVMLDLDRFKAVNDAHGHAFGDRVLVGLARLLRDNVREGADLPARIGGEEFAVLMADTDADGAAVIAERLRAGFAALDFATPAATEFYTASFGVAAFRPGDNVTGLLRRADEALYRSKQQGRDRVTVAGPGLRCRVPG